VNLVRSAVFGLSAIGKPATRSTVQGCFTFSLKSFFRNFSGTNTLASRSILTRARVLLLMGPGSKDFFHWRPIRLDPTAVMATVWPGGIPIWVNLSFEPPGILLISKVAME